MARRGDRCAVKIRQLRFALGQQLIDAPSEPLPLEIRQMPHLLHGREGAIGTLPAAKFGIQGTQFPLEVVRHVFERFEQRRTLRRSPCHILHRSSCPRPTIGSDYPTVTGQPLADLASCSAAFVSVYFLM